MDRRSFMKTSVPAVAALASGPLGAAGGFDWNQVRADFDLNPAYPQLSTVVSGLMPRPVRDEVVRLMDQSNQFRRAPGSNELPEGRSALRQRVRERAADFIGANAETIVLTRNTTEGIATVVANLPLSPGDEIIASTHEHPPYYGLLRQRQRRDGVVVKTVSVPTPAASAGQIASSFEAAMTKRTKLVLLTHVALTGQIFPVREITSLARQRGAQVVVDGALAVGHIAVDVQEIGCDYYCGNFHKWASGPPGTGILYVHPDRLESLVPLFGSVLVDANGTITSNENALDMGKFATVGRHPEYHFDALDILFDWHDRIGSKRREERLIDLANSWVRQASAIKGFRTVAAPNLSSSLAAWEIIGRPSEGVAEHLWKRHGLVLGLTDPLSGLFGEAGARPLLLTNTGLFTNESDLTRLLAGIADASSRG